MRLISDLYEIKKSSQNLDIKIDLSFVEFSKNIFIDLINTKQQSSLKKGIQLHDYNVRLSIY